MKSIIIGYKDAYGLTSPIIIASPEKDINDQFGILSDAQIRHTFPKGMERLELYVLAEPNELAQFVSDDAAKYAQQSDAKRVAEVAAQQEAAQMERDAADYLKQANRVFQAASTARNSAIGTMAVQRNLLASEGLDAKEKEKIQAKIKELAPSAEAAANKFNEVLASVEVLKNPKSLVKDKNKALADLGITKK